MFDYIKCEYPLPILEMRGRTFQSKSLECLMETYLISKEGRLLEKREIWEKTGKQIHNEFLHINEDEYVVKETLLDDTNYHGDVYFYDFRVPEDVDSHLVTFKARFTNGTVESIDEVKEN